MFVLLFYCYVMQKWTGDILLQSLEKEQSLISIIKTAEKHGFIASCLPAMHAFTGCDIVPKMFGIGKVSAFDFLQKNPLNHLGNLDLPPEVIAEEASTFVAPCYCCQGFCGYG